MNNQTTNPKGFGTRLEATVNSADLPVLTLLAAYWFWLNRMQKDAFSAKALWAGAFILFFTIAATKFFDGNMVLKERFQQFGVTGPFVLSLAFAILFLWNPESLYKKFGPLGSHPATWLTMVALSWIYFAVANLIMLKQREKAESAFAQIANITTNSIIPFQTAFQRWVLPRRITQEDRQNIASALRARPMVSCVFRVTPNDEEVHRFAEELRMSISDGGWVVVKFDYPRDLQPGVHIQIEQTAAWDCSDKTDREVGALS